MNRAEARVVTSETGRVNQKARTRQAIVAAARELAGRART